MSCVSMWEEGNGKFVVNGGQDVEQPWHFWEPTLPLPPASHPTVAYIFFHEFSSSTLVLCPTFMLSLLNFGECFPFCFILSTSIM